MKKSSCAFASILIALPLLMLSGCMTTSVDIVPVASHTKSVGALTLSGIKLESIYSYTEDMNELQGVIVSCAKKAGLIITPKDQAPGNRNSIQFFFREKSYTKGYQKKVSLALLAEIRNPDGEILYRITYIHDGEESFDSMGCVRKALDEVFHDLKKKLPKPDARDD